jgi:hypothetical protein
MTPNLAIASIMHNEARYLKEWITYHQIVGVSKFILLNDNSDDDYLPVLRPYRESGLVKFIEFPLIHGRVQSKAYEHALTLAKRGNDIDLLAAIDVDEFLFSPTYNTIQEALSQVPLPDQWSALSIPWRCFGDSGHTAYSPEPVTQRFTWRPDDSCYFNQWSKSILNLKSGGKISATFGDPHIFQTEFGTFDECGQPTTCPRENHSADLLRINHYFTKSRPEWEERHPIDRPILGNQYPRDESRFHGVQAKQVKDTLLWDRFGWELERRLAQ